MNSPTIDSMPASCGGRPETVAPNTTSSRPVKRAQHDPPGRLDDGVEGEPARRARASRSRVGAVLVEVERRTPATCVDSCASAASGGASRVGSSTPARAAPRPRAEALGVAARSATPGSRGTRARGAAAPGRPSVAYSVSSSRISSGIDQPSSRMWWLVEHQPVAGPRRGRDQHEPQQRRRGHVERAAPVLGQQSRDLGRRSVRRREPRRSTSRHGTSTPSPDHLHGLAVARRARNAARRFGCRSSSASAARRSRCGSTAPPQFEASCTM